MATSMQSQLFFVFQLLMSLLVYGLVARWYIGPTLKRLPIVQALTPLLLFHATRYIGLSFLTPSVIDPNTPSRFTIPAAAGDVLTMALALAALWALRRRSSVALLLLWIFNIVGTLDILDAFYQGLSIGLTNFKLGSLWFVPTLLVPALLVTHGLVFVMLRTRSQEIHHLSPHPNSSLRQSTTNSSSVGMPTEH